MSRRTREIAQSKLTTEILALMGEKHDIGQHERVVSVTITDFEQAPTLGPYVFEVWLFGEYSD